MAVTSMANSSIANYNKSNNVSGERLPLGSGGDYEGETNGYRYHVFTQSGTFTARRAGQVECLLIAGGGSGGAAGGAGGGGGAGGLIRTRVSVPAGANTVVVGDGGAAATSPANGNVGNDSTFAGLTAKGGGYGANNPSAGGTGGSAGGGGGGSSSTGNGGVAIDSATFAGYNGAGSQGHDGGEAAVNRGGGGGGAGSSGHNGGTLGDWLARNSEFFGKRDSGGIGLRLDDWGADATVVAGTAIGDDYTYTPTAGGSATAYYFAGGGGGGNDASTANVPLAPGGGGLGEDTNTSPTGGVANTGGGGGAANDSGTSGAGGSGILIVRYAV